MANEIRVYCDAMERPHDSRVTTGDIAVALKRFKEDTGTDATVIQLSPGRFDVLQSDIPEGLTASPRGGCAAYEIWIAIGEQSPPQDSIQLTEKEPEISTKVVEDPVLTTPDTPPPATNHVSKVSCGELATLENEAIYETPKKGRGRSLKTDDNVSRTTKWRRKKRMQGILPLGGL